MEPTAVCFGRGGKEAIVVGQRGSTLHLYKNYMSGVSKTLNIEDKVSGVEMVKGRDAFVTVGGVIALWQACEEE